MKVRRRKININISQCSSERSLPVASALQTLDRCCSRAKIQPRKTHAGIYRSPPPVALCAWACGIHRRDKNKYFLVFGTHPRLKIQPSVVLALHPGIFQRKDAGFAAAGREGSGRGSPHGRHVCRRKRQKTRFIFVLQSDQAAAESFRAGIGRLVVGWLKVSPCSISTGEDR